MLKPRALTAAVVVLLAVVFIVTRGIGSTPSVIADATTTPATDTPVATSTSTVVPTATSTPLPLTVSVVAASSTAGCSDQVQITVSGQTTAGPVPDGTPVSLSTTLGTINPSSGTTFGGGMFAVFTAPATTGGIATITATINGVTGSTNITVLCPSAAATLNFPSAQCAGFPPSSATVTFSWQPPQGAFFYFLDLSLSDNNFVPGTFLGAGPLAPGTSTLTWQGLIPGLPHFWRVNAFTPDGWVTSATGAFVPCGGPALRGIDYSCLGNGTASVRFHWAPGSPAGTLQFLDLTLFNNGFVPGTFLGGGPLPPTQQDLTWVGILANMQTYWRVNDLIWGWNATPTGSFVAACP